jgi:hypothetical protein
MPTDGADCQSAGRARDPEASFGPGCDSMAYLDNAGEKD